MKNTLLLLCFFLMCLPIQVRAQSNLVPNPSFEEYATCPDDVGNMDQTLYWSAYSATPDYLNSCADGSNYLGALVDVPSNIAGYQMPATGSAYAGLLTYNIVDPFDREIIGCKLISPMEIGMSYNISFKVSCGYGGDTEVHLATNGLGVKFSSVEYSFTNPIAMDNNPLVYSSTIITDTLNWVPMQWTIVADSAYQYVSIGNFFDDDHTDTIQFPGFIYHSYYYVDDVCVSTSEGECQVDGVKNLTASNVLSLSPNPASDATYLHINSFPSATIILYDSFGRTINKNVLSNYQFDAVRINTKVLEAGFYLVQCISNGQEYSKKLIVVH